MTSSAHGSEWPREAQGYNVVLIVFDTLRKDALGCYEQTPNWDADFPAIHTPTWTRSPSSRCGSPAPTPSHCLPFALAAPSTPGSAPSPSTTATSTSRATSALRPDGGRFPRTSTP